MNKKLIILSALTTLVILVAAFALVRGYISAQEAALSILFFFMSGICLLFWRNRRRKLATGSSEANKTSGLVWLLILFSVNACVGLVQAVHEGWDVGYTIGLAFFVLFAGLFIYEILRRKRMKTQSGQRAER